MSVGFSEALQATLPGVAMAALAVALMPWLDHQNNRIRTVVVAISLAATWRYVWWRWSDTIPPFAWSAEWFVAVAFAISEGMTIVGASMTSLLLSRTRNRSPEVDANIAWLRLQPRPPLVDVFICTYNEDKTILERTIVAALAMNYARFRVWVLDDGRRPWLKELCAHKGCNYLTRSDNSHAKAGNINNALRHVGSLRDPPDFISILDADCVPLPNLLTRVVCLFREDDVGIVQTTQHFVNPDPIQANLAGATIWPDEQRYFFDVILPSKDAWGLAFCCGASSMLRYVVLKQIGGFPTDTITEDFHVTLKMSEVGFRTVYLNEMLSVGLSAEGLKEYATQRTRWCAGFMQIVRGPQGPFQRNSRVPLLYRISLIEVLLYWFGSFSFRLLCLLVPVAYWMFGIRAVDAGVDVTLSYFLPYFVSQTTLTSWLGQGRIVPLLADVNQLLVAPEVLKAAFFGLLKPKGHKFEVTPKGKIRDQRQVQWMTMRRFSAVLICLIVSMTLSFLSNESGALEAAGGLCLFWSWYNIVMLTIACAVCVERPRFRTDERVGAREDVVLHVKNHSHRHGLLDLSISGMRIAGVAPAPVGVGVTVTFRGSGVPATIVRVGPTEFALRLDGEAARDTMIRHFYSDRYIGAAWDVRIGRVMATLLRRVLG